jgi:hypothetical protein
MYSKLFFRGDRRGILIIGDSPPPEQSPVKNIVTVFDPVHPIQGLKETRQRAGRDLDNHIKRNT